MIRDKSTKLFEANAPFWGSWSVQIRLILLVLMAVVPALGIIIHTGFLDKQNEVEIATRNILQSVDNLARLQETITVSTKQTLMTIANYPEIQNGNVNACNTLFESLLSQSQHLGTIIATVEDGTAIAAGKSNATFSLADRDYFQKALKTRSFTAGGYIVARSNNVPALPFAFPVINDQEQIEGVVVATVNLNQYEELFHHMSLPEGSLVGIEDLNGIRLYRFPQLDGAIDKGIGDPLPRKIWETISGSQRTGTYTEQGEDGIRRIYGFVQLRLQGDDKPYLYIRVGVPEESALLPANIRLAHNLLLFSIAGICALGTAFFFGNLTIVNPIIQLVEVSRKMGTGNFNVRSGVSHTKNGEIGILAKTFDHMTSSLREREIERLKSEESIRQLSEQNQLILNAAEEGIVGLDPQGVVVFINPSAAAVTGYDAHELLGQDLHDRIHHSLPDGSAYPHELCPMHKTLSQGTASRVTDEVLWRKDGTSFPAAYSSTPIVKDGTITGAVITFRDITLRKQAEYAVRQTVHELQEHRIELEMQNEMLLNAQVQLDIAKERYFNLYDLAPVGYVTISEKGMMQETNLTAATLFGVTRSMLANKALTQFIFKEDQDTYYLHQKQSFGTGQPSTCVLRLLKKDGSFFWANLLITTDPDQGGNPLFRIAISDITELKKLEKELFLAKKLEIIGQLAGGVAHEVRNPLNAILSITEALFTEKAIADNPDYQPYIEHIRTQVNRLSKLMTDLLSLGKPIKSANIHSFSLNQLCSDTIKLWQLSKEANKHPVTLVCGLAQHDPWVRTDGMHLQQALLNLMDNAARCSPAGKGILLKISETGNSKVCIEIRDSGEGIPHQKIERIFEPFFTLTKGGTGLGLTLVKHFIENMGGEIIIRNNEPPPGCTAELILNTVKGGNFESKIKDIAH